MTASSPTASISSIDTPVADSVPLTMPAPKFPSGAAVSAAVGAAVGVAVGVAIGALVLVINNNVGLVVIGKFIEGDGVLLLLPSSSLSSSLSSPESSSVGSSSESEDSSVVDEDVAAANRCLGAAARSKAAAAVATDGSEHRLKFAQTALTLGITIILAFPDSSGFLDFSCWSFLVCCKMDCRRQVHQSVLCRKHNGQSERHRSEPCGPTEEAEPNRVVGYQH